MHYTFDIQKHRIGDQPKNSIGDNIILKNMNKVEEQK